MNGTGELPLAPGGRLSPEGLSALRDRLRMIERPDHGVTATGLAEIDSHLPWSGLPRGALHEIIGSSTDGAPLAFAAHLLGCFAAHGPTLWIGGGFYPPAFGLWIDSCLAVRTEHYADRLWAAEEALRTKGVGGVLLEVSEIDLTGSRRLQLAAESHGAALLLLRRRAQRGTPSDKENTVSLTRWRVHAAASAPTAWGGPGAARWCVELKRCRGGRPGEWIVERDDEKGSVTVVAALRSRPFGAVTAGLAV